MNNKNFTIGILSVTAVILFVALVIVQVVGSRHALAYGQSSSSGKYVVTTCKLDEITGMVYILNTELQRMNVYGFNPPAGRIDLIQPFDIKLLSRELQRFTPRGGPDVQEEPRGRGRRR